MFVIWPVEKGLYYSPLLLLHLLHKSQTAVKNIVFCYWVLKGYSSNYLTVMADTNGNALGFGGEGTPFSTLYLGLKWLKFVLQVRTAVVVNVDSLWCNGAQWWRSKKMCPKKWSNMQLKLLKPLLQSNPLLCRPSVCSVRSKPSYIGQNLWPQTLHLA